MKNKKEKTDKVFAVKKLRRGGGFAHFRERRVGQEQKMCLSRRGFYKKATVLRTPWMWQVSELTKFESKTCSLSPDVHGPTGWTWSSLSGLRSCGAAAAFRPINTAPFLLHLCLKNTFLDTHKPSIPFLDPTEMHIFLSKPCFSTVNCLERIAVLPISYLPFMRRRGRTLM